MQGLPDRQRQKSGSSGRRRRKQLQQMLKLDWCKQPSFTLGLQVKIWSHPPCTARSTSVLQQAAKPHPWPLAACPPHSLLCVCLAVGSRHAIGIGSNEDASPWVGDAYACTVRLQHRALPPMLRTKGAQRGRPPLCGPPLPAGRLGRPPVLPDAASGHAWKPSDGPHGGGGGGGPKTPPPCGDGEFKTKPRGMAKYAAHHQTPGL